MRARAAAKINLHLGVGAARDDGFHPLCTVYQAIALYDDVTAARRRRLVGWTTRAEPYVDRAAVPGDGDNIVTRAGAAARRPATASSRRPTCWSRRRSRSPAGWPAGRPTPPRRWSRSTGCGTCRPPAPSCSSSLPSSAATCRSRCSAAPRSAPAAASWSSRSPIPATWWWVVVPPPGRPVHAGGLPPLRRAVPRRRRQPAPADACSRRWPRATRGRSPPPCTTTCRRPAFDLRPDLRGAARARRGGGRAAGPGLRLRPDLRVPLRVRGARRRRGRRPPLRRARRRRSPRPGRRRRPRWCGRRR